MSTFPILEVEGNASSCVSERIRHLIVVVIFSWKEQYVLEFICNECFEIWRMVVLKKRVANGALAT